MNQPVSTQPDWLRWLRHGNRPVVMITIIATVALIALTTFNQSADRDWCALFDDYSITKNERHRILLALGTAGLDGYRIDRGQIMVKDKEKAKYLVAVSENNALPTFYDVEQEYQLSPFMPRSQLILLEFDRRKKQIRDMILRLPFVAEAWLEMDGAASENMFQPDEHSAVVQIQPKNSLPLTREQVESIQKLVSSAIVGIKRENVAVIDSSVGITYQDIRDAEQSRLIDFVNWKITRQSHYQQLLSELVGEYPGIEIEVRVEPLDEKRDPSGNDKIAVENPDKLAARPKVGQPVNIETGQVGLNSSASVVVTADHQADPESGVESLNVVRTAILAFREHLPTNVPESESPNWPAAGLTTTGNQNEVVRITAHIPFALVASFQSSEADIKATAAEKFDALKHQIVARIRQLIPASALAQQQPISILLMDAPENGTTGNEELMRALQLYWPIAAIVLVGLISIIGARSQTVRLPPVVAATTAPTDESQELHLQQQLAHLIDSDPATAAKVIKSWIRQTN